MKRLWQLFLILMLALTIAPRTLADENLYQHDSLDIQLQVEGGFILTPQSNDAEVGTVSAELYLVPQENSRQEIVLLETSGSLDQNRIRYAWEKPSWGEHFFGYTATVRTYHRRPEVGHKIPFPLESLEGMEQYLQDTKTIDASNPAIVAQASDLVEGEDDLFKAVFKLARWVEENVAYNLSTLTAETSQPASWVMQNRYGVCDEITSLFVAMTRAVGIPARFVSGISYTTSDLFNDPWQPHGWAEVYFPDIGWVPFDITFGEYGYIDVTHLKLRDGFDPQEPATRYEWVTRDAELQAQELAIKNRVLQQGALIPTEISLEQQILAEEVAFGSYNLVKGIVKNHLPFYAATTLKLAVPDKIEIIGRNKRIIPLLPNEVQETYWIIKVPEDLDDRYVYTFPLLLYSEKNSSVDHSFTASKDKLFYAREEIERLIVTDEEKSYSRKVSIDCAYPIELALHDSATISCTVKNSGNVNLQNLLVCIAASCRYIGLPIHQQEEMQYRIDGDVPGWKKVIVTAENENIEKRIALQYAVMDPPSVEVSIQAPEVLAYGQSLELNITAMKTSFSAPKEVLIIIRGFGQEVRYELEELHEDRTFSLLLNGKRLSWSNEIGVIATWSDQEGKVFSQNTGRTITGKAIKPLDRLTMLWNKILNLLEQ